MTTGDEWLKAEANDAFGAFDATWGVTDLPAIALEPTTFVEYLRDQAGYYRSLDDTYSIAVADILEAEALHLERREKRRAAEQEPAM